MEGFLSKSHQFPDDTVGHFNGANEHQHIEHQFANVVPDDRCRGKSFRYDNATEEGRYQNRRTELVFID